MVDEKSRQVRERLRAAYAQTSPGEEERARTGSTAEEAIRDHADLVRKLARRYARAAGGALDVDDLTSVGIMGLLQAHQNYDPAGGKPFRTYAEFRVRGAILDELRRLDPLSQPQRRKVRALDASVRNLANRLGREPNEDELAEYMGLPLDELQSMRAELVNVQFVGGDSQDIDDIRVDLAGSRMDRQSLRVVLTDAIQKLPERDQHVLALYYLEDLRLREIGEVLDVTEARVCQLHKAAVEKLRSLLGGAGAFP